MNEPTFSWFKSF